MNNPRHADDAILITDSEGELQNILATVTVESENKRATTECKEDSAW